MPVDSSGWDTTKDAHGWPISASSDVAPMESPMERFAKGFSAIFHQGQPFIRSRQDVWKEKHDTASYLDKYLQNEEAGQVARQEMAQGLPNYGTQAAVARAKLQKSVDEQRGEWMGAHNPLAEDSMQKGREFEASHPWLSDAETQRQEKSLGYGHFGGGTNDTQARIDYFTKDIPAEQQPAVRTALAERAMGLTPGSLSRGLGHTSDFDSLHDKIQKSGLQDQYEVGSDAYGYKIQPKRAFATKDIAAFKMRADQLKQTSDQIAKERRILELDQKRKPNEAQAKMIETRLGILDKEEAANKSSWKDLLENRPEDVPEEDYAVQDAAIQGAEQGAQARPLVPQKTILSATDQAAQLGDLTDDEIAIAKDEDSQGKSRDEIADIIARRRRAQHANP